MTLIERITPALRENLLQHAQAESPRECCGLLVATPAGELMYVPAINTHAGDAGRDRFRLEDDAWLRADELGTVAAVVHSHPNASANPSMADRAQCERSQLPWLIVGTPSGALVELQPSGWRAPMEGREFCHGVLDCYTLAQDWYWREWGLQLPDFDREDGWWDDDKGTDLYMANFAAAGFVQLPAGAQLQRGDGLLMRVRSDRVNHAAVHQGDGYMLHHLYGQLSRRERYDWPWERRTALVVRHQSRMADAQQVAA